MASKKMAGRTTEQASPAAQPSPAQRSAPRQTSGMNRRHCDPACRFGFDFPRILFPDGAVELICISQNFNDRRARAVHSDWQSTSR